MSQQSEIDALEKQVADMRLRVGGSGIKKMLLEQMQLLRKAAKDNLASTDNIQTTAETSSSNFDISALIEKLSTIQDDISHLKNNLNLKEKPSINYEKIEIIDVRKQLIADNIRMECAKLDLSHYHDFHEEQAFRRYCVFAFFQIEQLLNYYFHKKFPYRMTELKRDFISRGIDTKYVEKCSKLNQVKPFVFIKAYNHEFFISKNNPKTWGLDNIREVRNMEEHRCNILLKPLNLSDLEIKFRDAKKREDNGLTLSQDDKITKGEYYLVQFIRGRNFDSVRMEVENLYKNVTK